MTLNGVLAPILRYFTVFIALEADYVTLVEDRRIMSADYRLPLLDKTDTAQSPCDEQLVFLQAGITMNKCCFVKKLICIG